MKTQITERKHHWRPSLVSFGLALALIGLAIAAKADDLIVNSFDTGISGIDWQNFRSYIYGYSETWDPTQDSQGNPNSGSMYLTVNWPYHSDTNWNQSWNDVQLAFYTGAFDTTNYIQFDVDVKIDVTNSSPALDGTYGALELIVNNPWTTVVGWAQLEPTNGWQHFTGYFSGIPAGTNSEAVIGFISNGSSSLTNTVNYWIDNIVFTAPPSVHTNRPNLTIAKAPGPGLTCIASQPGGTYQRQMIATVTNTYSWNTASAASSTTTYSMTITNFPSGVYGGFTAQMFLIPQPAGTTSPVIDGSIDWDSTNVVALFVGENPDGTGAGTFQYKINNPSSWTTSLMVNKNCASGPLGKWTMTFKNNTNVTVTAPDLTSTNFNIPASDAGYFVDPLYVYVGSQPNNNANLGQSATFSRVTIAGAGSSLDDNFISGGTPYRLNSGLWTLNVADANGVFITPPDAKFWITWPLPDDGYTNLYATDNLTNRNENSQWMSLPVTGTSWVSIGSVTRLAVVNQSTLNSAFSHSPTNCFFELYHP